MKRLILGMALLFAAALAGEETTVHRAPNEPANVSKPASTRPPVKGAVSSRAMTQYSHGDPTNEEQQMLEMINRARANPTAEGVRLATTTDPNILAAYAQYMVNTQQLETDFAGYPVQPPLAFNPMLIASARVQSQDMATNNFQSHTGSDGSTFVQRILTAGYPSNYTYLGENIFAYVLSVFYGHAGLNADWGNPGLGHRINIMNFTGPVFIEVGIGIIDVPNPPAGHTGPLVVTQDFAQGPNGPFLLGVVFTDNDSNGFYDLGEGLAGVTITPSSGTAFAITSSSGGYAFPVATSGTLTVTASGGALPAPIVQNVVLTGSNVKLDFIVTPPPPSQAPAITSAPMALGTVGTEFNYTITATENPASFNATGLPEGLTVSAASGLISGTPAAVGLSLVDLSATNAAGTGTATLNLAILPAGSSGTTDFTITKASVKFNFKTQGLDSLSVSGSLPLPANFEPSGADVNVSAGNFLASATLNSKGSAPQNAFKLSGKMVHGAFVSPPVKFSVTIKKQSLFPLLNTLGFANATVAKPGMTVNVPLLITVGETSFEHTLAFRYTATQGKSGSGVFP